MKGAYYNEFDPYAAQWLRNLIAAGHIAPGDVDERSIVDVRSDDLRGYRQCHFFAGIGVWSYALRQAGWADDREVWTGSCPCQPFSAAGAGQADEDDRHLAPAWLRLIRECRPSVVFGEQVGAAVRVGWLDVIFAEMEQLNYACGAVDFPACSVGAPHIRQRLYFVADSAGQRRVGQHVLLWPEAERRIGAHEVLEAAGSCESGELADADGGDASAEGLQRSRKHGLQSQDGSAGGVVGDAEISRGGAFDGQSRSRNKQQEPTGGSGISFWSNADWIPCIDGKARPVEPGTSPLAHGATARMGRLRAYGNAICAPQAAEFIRAYEEIRRRA
ncbi:MAG: DNA cytosine methyltransferase [Candidatus Acidiferrales bacterium]